MSVTTMMTMIVIAGGVRMVATTNLAIRATEVIAAIGVEMTAMTGMPLTDIAGKTDTSGMTVVDHVKATTAGNKITMYSL